ncbi:MAG: DUF167 domain-containing protein [Magnetovibrio sp.]|nr:DUF167 domain-containing protein [Magnetovibrio sp.]
MPRALFEPTAKGLRVRIRLTPAGRHDGINGLMHDVDGCAVLKASVTKAPEDGKANAALIKLLAKNWKVAKSTIEIIQGHTSRNKVLLIAGDAANLQKIIGIWLDDQGYV